MIAARPLCLLAALALAGGTAAGAAVQTTPAIQTTPAALQATPQLPPLLVRQVAGFPRILVRLPAGTPTFEPSLQRLGSVLSVSLPPAALPAGLSSTAPSPLALTGGRTLQVQWTAQGLTLAGLNRNEDVRAVLWPEAGGLPPQLALLFSEAGSRPQVVVPKPQPASLQAPPEPAISPQVVAGILGDLQAQASRLQQHHAPAAPPTPELGPVQPMVVLDPGHGGNDPGMTSRWVREADVNLDVALRAARALKSAGVQVVLTRRSDVHLHPRKGPDLELRSRMATTGRASAFVSIHVNAANGPSAHGIETYYFGQPPASGARSLAVRENGGGDAGAHLTAQARAQAEGLLGDLLGEAKLSFSRQLAVLVQRELVAATGARDRGVKQDAFYVIRRPTTPAILTELGFGSNPVEGQRLATPQYRETQAQAIARAVVRFLNAGR